MAPKKQKKKANPIMSVVFFLVLMFWLFYSTDKMNIWLSGFIALVLVAIFVILTMIMERRGSK